MVVASQIKGNKMLVLSQPLSGGQGSFQDQVGIRHKQDSLLGQFHIPAGADKKFHPQLLLQRLDLMADSRLRQLQGFGSFGKIQMLRHREKTFQLNGIHNRTNPFFRFFLSKMENGRLSYLIIRCFFHPRKNNENNL